MAESKNNVVTHGMSGKIDLLVFRQKNGKTFVSKSPKEKKGNLSTAQQQVQQKFQQAVIYAKTVLADASAKTAYEEKADIGQTAYNVAIADFFNAPDIREIDVSNYTGQIGSKIVVKVTDDFKVASVHVQINNNDSSLVEEGEAIAAANGLDWVYTTTTLNASLSGDKITVTASDLPGNDTIDEKTLS
jgi:thiol:disulfide interchange protein